MAQTNTVSVFVQMTAVTASGVADRLEDCSKLLLQWLWSSFCQVLFLSQWQRGSRTQQIEDDRHTVSCCIAGCNFVSYAPV